MLAPPPLCSLSLSLSLLSRFDPRQVAPLLSLHHEARVFRPVVGLLDMAAFFESMWRDPIGFLQLATCIVRGVKKHAQTKFSTLVHPALACFTAIRALRLRIAGVMVTAAGLDSVQY